MDQKNEVEAGSILLRIGTWAAVLAIALPMLAWPISDYDTFTLNAHNWMDLEEHQATERLAATIQVLGLLAAIVLIGTAAVRIRLAYPTVGAAAGLVFVLAGTVFVLLRLLTPLGIAGFVVLDPTHSDVEDASYLLDGFAMIARSASLLFVALAAFAIAVAAKIEGRKEGLVHIAFGVVILLLGSLSMALDRDPASPGLIYDHTWTRAGGPLTIAGLALTGFWALWLARRPRPLSTTSESASANEASR